MEPPLVTNFSASLNESKGNGNSSGAPPRDGYKNVASSLGRAVMLKTNFA